MMHETGKSDPAIVAVKSANEAVQTAKELMEPRAGARGNVLQQSTHQTQSWVSVTQALERIRQIAPTICRHSPKVGAVCLNWARTVLCGGGAQ